MPRMRVRKLESTIGIWCLLIFFIVDESTSQSDLAITPRESIVVQGQNVTLTCNFVSVNASSGEERFWWLRPDHNFRFVRNEAVLLGSMQRQRYTVSLVRKSGVYSLAIRNIQLLDGGKFACSQRSGRYADTATSEVATLTILSPPAGGYPRCKFLAKSNLIISPSRKVALSCPKMDNWRWGSRSNKNRDSVYFTWGELDGFALQNGTTLLSHTAEASPREGSFCMTDHPYLQRFPNQCTLVVRVDVAAVLIKPAAVHVRVGENMTFTCKVNGAVQALRYEWAIPRNIPAESVKISKEGSEATLINVQAPPKRSSTEGSIVCEVTLENGKLKAATANVTIIRSSPGHPNNVRNGDVKSSPPMDGTSNDTEIGRNLKETIMEFVSTPQTLAILIGPTIAIVVFFMCFYLMLRFAINKRVAIVTAPPKVITTPPAQEAEPCQVNSEHPDHSFRVSVFPRSYSDAAAYRLGRNFQDNESFQLGKARSMDPKRNQRSDMSTDHHPENGSHSQHGTDNFSMPSLDYKSNTLPTKGRRNRERDDEFPLPPSSLLERPNLCARSSSHLTPPRMEWIPKERSV